MKPLLELKIVRMKEKISFTHRKMYLREAMHEEKSSDYPHTVPTHLEHQTIGAYRIIQK